MVGLAFIINLFKNLYCNAMTGLTFCKTLTIEIVVFHRMNYLGRLSDKILCLFPQMKLVKQTKLSHVKNTRTCGDSFCCHAGLR